MNEDDILEINHLSSSASFRISLESIRNGEHGLNEARRKLLQRVPETGDWALYPRDSISIKDLAYISAKVRHEFALLRGKRKDILFHGSAGRCDLGEELIDLLRTRKYRLVAHTHPDYDRIVPSEKDRAFLKYINQDSSIIVSYITGEQETFYQGMF